jgi:hypothetical protein
MNVIETIAAAVAVVAIGWLLLVAFLWLHRPSRELAGAALRLVPDLVRRVDQAAADDRQCRLRHRRLRDVHERPARSFWSAGLPGKHRGPGSRLD